MIVRPPIYKVAAYITAYQDHTSLYRCIRAIQHQDYPVEIIVVVDNSPISIIGKGEKDLLIWHCPENVGISGGVNKFMQWAEHQDYQFVWMFDQDSEPQFDCLGKLIRAYTHLVVNHPVGIVAPVPVDLKTQRHLKPLCFWHYKFKGINFSQSGQLHECDSPITSGSLLWLKTLDSVPVPDIRLFIDGIDLDYGFRLKQAGYKNFVVTQAFMSHDFGCPTEIRILGKKIFLQNYSALRYYYICRNHTYVELKFSQGIYKFICLLRRIKFLGLRLFLILIMKTDDTPKKIWACFRGTYYGLLGDLDQQFYVGKKTSL